MRSGSGGSGPSGIPDPWTPVVVERVDGGLSRYPAPGRQQPGDREPADGTASLLVEALACPGVDRALLLSFSGGRARLLGVEEGADAPQVLPGGIPGPVGQRLEGLLNRLGLLAVEDARREPRPEGVVGDWMQGRDTRALLAARVGREDDGRPAGALVLEVLGRARPWTEADREQIRSLAVRLGPLLPAAPTGVPASPEPTPRSPAVEPEGPVSTPGPDAPTRPRTGLDAPLRRLAPMEGAGILGLELVRELRDLEESQAGFLALLEEVLEPGSVEAALVRDARDAGRRGLDRIREYLAWTEEGSGAHRPLELNALVAELSVRLGKITGDSVPLVFSPSARPVRVRGTSSALARAVEHLVRNAREASREGDRVRLSVRTRTSEEDGSLARLEVVDSGSGVDGELLPWVFEPFVTGWRARGEGGLGLSVARAVAEGHGGRIELVSRPGQGTTAVIELPLGSTDAEAPLEEGRGAGADARRGDERPLVVVVVDDPILSRLLDRTLDRGGFRVQRVEHVDGARRLLGRIDTPVRLLAVQARGPAGESGEGFVREARADRPECPAVLLDRGRRRRAEDGERPAGPEDIPVLSPPFDPADVLAMARRLVPPAPDADAPIH